MLKARTRFALHRANAKHRNIPFLLTFEEWWNIWQDSGKWGRRGWRKGEYCMSRFGDKGAYAVSNVRICLNEENRAERNQNYPRPGKLNAAYGKNYWLDFTPEQAAAMREACGKRFKGIPKSVGQRAKMAEVAIGRRVVTRNGRRTWSHPGDADYPI